MVYYGVLSHGPSPNAQTLGQGSHMRTPYEQTSLTPMSPMTLMMMMMKMMLLFQTDVCQRETVRHRQGQNNDCEA